jgi:hypothetical protein
LLHETRQHPAKDAINPVARADRLTLQSDGAGRSDAHK